MSWIQMYLSCDIINFACNILRYSFSFDLWSLSRYCYCILVDSQHRKTHFQIPKKSERLKKTFSDRNGFLHVRKILLKSEFRGPGNCVSREKKNVVSISNAIFPDPFFHVRHIAASGWKGREDSPAALIY